MDCYSFDMDNDENISRSLTKYEASELLAFLKNRRLPGLSDQEQMHLLAMIDTFVEVSIMNLSVKNGDYMKKGMKFWFGILLFWFTHILVLYRFLVKVNRWMKMVPALPLCWKITSI